MDFFRWIIFKHKKKSIKNVEKNRKRETIAEQNFDMPLISNFVFGDFTFDVFWQCQIDITEIFVFAWNWNRKSKFKLNDYIIAFLSIKITWLPWQIVHLTFIPVSVNLNVDLIQFKTGSLSSRLLVVVRISISVYFR